MTKGCIDMKKNIFAILLLGFVLLLNACGIDEEQLTQVESTTSNGRECITIAGDKSLGHFIDDNYHDEIMSVWIGDLDAFFNHYIDNYTGFYYGFYFANPDYVILFADELDNWQTPEI